MIHVDRSRVAVPTPLRKNSAAWQAAMRRAEKHFNLPPEKRKTRSFGFKVLWSDEALEAARKLFHNKCAFCETQIGPASAGYVEHFRPKARAMQMDGTVSEDHYWWLAYEWTNLHLSCAACNSSKRSRFPVEGQRAGRDDLHNEKKLLLDPCHDRPDQHLLFDERGLVLAKTQEGEITIEVFGLNRDDLVARRRDIALRAQALFLQLLTALSLGKSPEETKKTNEVVELVKSRMADSEPFAAMWRQCIRQQMEQMNLGKLVSFGEGRSVVEAAKKLAPRVTEKDKKRAHARKTRRSRKLAAYSVEDAAQKEEFFSGAKRVESIEIKNFKAITYLKLKLKAPATGNEPWMMLIGENGTGKSSILQAVGLTLMGEEHCNELGLNASRFVRRELDGGGPRSGYVKVRLTNLPFPIKLSFRLGSPRFKVEPKEPKVLLLGYGATRMLPRDGDDDGGDNAQSKYIRVKNLFDPRAPLNDAERWLEDTQRLPAPDFDKVRYALKDLLLLREGDDIERTSGGIGARVNDSVVCLHELSDGFQSVLAFSCDMMIVLLEKWKQSWIEESEAVVLLDELDAHLHPSWKLEIVRRLRRAFPRLAFLATTHDPLCLKGLHDGEIVVLRRDEQKKLFAITDVPSVNNLRADQILTSFMFDLTTTRGDEAVTKIARYSELLGRRRRTAQEEAEFVSLRQELDSTLSGESSPTRQLVEHAVQKTFLRLEPPKLLGTLARTEKKLKQPGARGRLTEDVKLEIKRQLKELASKKEGVA